MFQRASFHHRLGPESKNGHMPVRAAVGTLAGIILLHFMIFAFVFTFITFYLFPLVDINNLKHILLNMNRKVNPYLFQMHSKYLVHSYYVESIKELIKSIKGLIPRNHGIC